MPSILENTDSRSSRVGEPLLRVENLSVQFIKPHEARSIVKNIQFSISRGETFALVGENASGKSVTAQSVLQLFPYFSNHRLTGQVYFQNQPLIGTSEPILEALRGGKIGMIFQDPIHSLNPLHPIGQQIGESLALHSNLSGRECHKRVMELLKGVGIKHSEHRIHAFPHELSGGECQRVMIAMAIANDPLLLIADEPTTSLDVINEAEILKLLKSIQQKLGMAILLITHSLKMVRKVADRVAVLKEGEIVENKSTGALFQNPSHPYTQALLNAERLPDAPSLSASNNVLLSVQNVSVSFTFRKGLFRRVTERIKAVDHASFELQEGETLGIVGASGSGKSTLCAALCRLHKVQGKIYFRGAPLHALSPRALRPLRRELQIVFQNPFRCLNPRWSVQHIIEEGLAVHYPSLTKSAREARVIALMQTVGLDPKTRHHYPHEFSGGQKQRIAIARAVILKPQCIILDEPTSALDHITQKQILELLRRLQVEFNLAYLFISHDLTVIRSFCHRVLVMQNGRIIESGFPKDIFAHPQHEYTKQLVKAALLQI
ncbi:MAG: ABC transporter ATP-binding protein [Gammaproteobacteria bacterium]|nr:ABC transporter ATP-binding protein [Gammaproteobacteria bacterium]